MNRSLARVTVLGAGSWGTALAALSCANASTLLWGRNASQAETIHNTHRNPHYLPDIHLPENLQATANFEAAVAHAAQAGHNGLIILGVPVAGMPDTCSKLANLLAHYSATALPHVIWTCKGFQAESGLLPHQVVAQTLGQLTQLGSGVLSGPSFAREVAQGLPVALTIASYQPATARLVTQVLHGSSARIYSSTDIIGVETAGALKNIMAIACGISDAQGLGANARAALITRALAEMRRLGVALGGQAETFSGLAGIGDLVLTATGDLSRNRQVGLAIGRGQSLDTILANNLTAEGVRCAQVVLEMGSRHQIELPITKAVTDVLFNQLTPVQAIQQLLSRDARAE